MILILSQEDDGHVPLVTAALDRRRAAYVWLDPGRVVAEGEVFASYTGRGVARRRLRVGNHDVDLDEIHAVWVRRPGRPVAAATVTDPRHRAWIAAESEEFLAGLWQTLECDWVPARPDVTAAGYNKTSQLALAARLGFQVPRTLIGNSPGRFLEFSAECEGRLVSKTVRDPIVQRDGETYGITTRVVQRRDAAAYQAVRYAPVIFQEYVPKQVELRITVVGARVFAAEIHSQASRVSRHDWRHYDFARTPYAVHALPAALRQRCVRLLRALGLRFGTIDMVVTPAREYVFLEINPNGQWGWIEERTGLPIARAIAGLLARGSRVRR